MATPEASASPDQPKRSPLARSLERTLADTASAVARAQVLARRVQGIADQLPTPEETAIGIAEDVFDALGAITAVAVRVTSDGKHLEAVGVAHVPPDVAGALDAIPIDANLPIAEAARTGQPCYCESREALLARFPAMREVAERLDLHAVAAVPVRHLARVHGAIAFGFPTPRRFAAGEKATLRVMAGRYARALHGARRYYAEHEAHTAEAAARRTAEEARAVAEGAARAQGDFVAVVSHELRTPLQAILGYADLLAEEVGGGLTPTQHGYVERIATAGATLLQIVENLLGFSAAQIGSQRVDTESFDVGDVARDVAALAEPLARRAGLALRVVEPAGAVTLASDARKVRQVVTNLVANAIKFTECGEVVVTVDAPEPGWARVSVRDTGSGIAASELPRLFEPFWQGGRAPGSASGTGLGLSIVRQLVQLLGGEVTVESAVGAGSTFTVRLPDR